MIRASTGFAVLITMAACGLMPGDDRAEVAPAEAASVSAITAADLVNFPDGENCEGALEARAAQLFENWFAACDHVKTAMMVDYSSHSTVAWNNGGSFHMVLRAVVPGEAGGLILQIQTQTPYGKYDTNELAFFDAAGNHIATVPGVYYFHLNDNTLLVSTAMRDSGEFHKWYMVYEELAAVSLTGKILWKAPVGGEPYGDEWATYNPNLSSWNMYHPRLGESGPNSQTSALYRTPDDKLLWAYHADYSGSPLSGIRTLDPATGKDVDYETAASRDRLCALTSTDPDCATWAEEASVRAEWWAYWNPMYSSGWKVTGFVPPTDDDHWLMVEVSTVRFSSGGQREDGRKLLFYPIEIEYPYYPYSIVDGMYYFHADDDTIVASLAMGSSGWYSRTQTPWYDARERLTGLSAQGVPLWERPFAGRPVKSDSTATLTRIEGGAVLWWSHRATSGVQTSLEVFDPITGRRVPAPSVYARRATCTPAGTPLWTTRTITPNLPFTRSEPAVSTLAMTAGDAVKGVVLVQAYVDNTRHGASNDVTMVLERDGSVIIPAYPWFRDDLDSNRVSELGAVASAFKGQPIAGDWTLRVANADKMELTWWTLAVERPVPGPNRYSFTATETNNAKVATANQTIALAAGQTITVGTCGVYGASFHGDTYLRVFNAAGVQVAKNDDACGAGSRITYTAQTSETIEVRAGCFVNYSCDGQVAWMVY